MNENLELRFISEYLGETVKDQELVTDRHRGFSPVALGVKLKLADEKGWWPQAALLGHLNLKTGNRDFMPDYTSANFRFSFSHTLSDQWSLGYNVGAAWNGETPEAIFLYTLSIGYALNKKLAAFAETYSFFPEKGKADNRLDGGFTYKVTSVLQFDLSGGIGLSHNAPDFFVSTGCSFRLFK